ETGAGQMPNGVVTDPHIFVKIDKDGTVTIVAARAEMGTGAARTTLPMILADELDADWARVRVGQGEGDEKKYGNQDTDGSRRGRRPPGDAAAAQRGRFGGPHARAGCRQAGGRQRLRGGGGAP